MRSATVVGVAAKSPPHSGDNSGLDLGLHSRPTSWGCVSVSLSDETGVHDGRVDC